MKSSYVLYILVTALSTVGLQVIKPGREISPGSSVEIFTNSKAEGGVIGDAQNFARYDCTMV